MALHRCTPKPALLRHIARTNATSAAAKHNSFLSVALPDLWLPVPEPPVQIARIILSLSEPPSHPPFLQPYVPDFWHSSLKTATPLPEQPLLPKLLVVAGPDTHISAGPSHNLLDETAPLLATPISPATPSKPTTDDGIWGDMTDDIGLPRPRDMKAAFWKLFS